MYAFIVDRMASLLRWRNVGPTALSLAVLSSSLHAASSNVVGFYNVTVPAGNSAWVCGLVGADAYQGAAVTVTADVDGKALVTFAAPGWAGGDFPLHYAEPQSGTSAGLAIDVISNTTDTLKLNATPAGAGLTAGTVFIVRKHATLKGLLPDGGGFVPFQDTIALFGANGAQSTYFFNDGTGTWITILGADASNVVVRPGQGFILQVAALHTLTLGKGEVAYVKSTPTQITATAKVPNLVGALNPLSSTTTLGSLGIVSNLETFNDSIVTLNPGSLVQTGTFLSDGTNFINGLGANSNGVVIPSGASVVVNVDTSKTVTLTPVTVAP